jgi:SAM-dependent methyltransferase
MDRDKNRGQYEQRLTGYWLKALPDVAARLQAGGRALDVGCGAGRVCMALARNYPAASILGLDPDKESIRRAESAAAAAGLSGRVSFIAASTGDLDARERFDLITACDCIHDFAAPERTLQEIHDLLKPQGTLFIIELKAGDRLEDNINPIGTMFYGFSIFHCMTQSLARGGHGAGHLPWPGPHRGAAAQCRLPGFRASRYQEPDEFVLRCATLSAANRGMAFGAGTRRGVGHQDADGFRCARLIRHPAEAS